MRKLFILILVVVIGLGIYSLMGSDSNTDYAEFLPSKALITFSLNSPTELIQKFSKDDFGPMLENVSQQSKSALGDDVLSPDFYRSNGIDPRKPVGFSFFGMESQGKMSLAVFFGVHSQSKFFTFVKEKLVKMAGPVQLVEKNMASLDCIILSKNAFPGAPKVEKAVCTVKDGFCIIYVASVDPNNPQELENKFTQDIASSENRLSKSPSFQSSVKELGGLGDFFVYADYPKLMQLSLMMTPPDQHQMLQQAMESQKDITSFAMSTSIKDNKLKIAAYNHCENGSSMLDTYRSDRSCKELALLLAENPLTFFAMNMDFPAFLPEYKKMLEPALSLIMPGQASSIEEMLQGVNQSIEKELGVAIDVEKDLLMNIKGNGMFTLYSLPENPESMDVDAVIALGLVDAGVIKEKIEQLLQSAQTIQQENQGQMPPLPISAMKIGEADAWIFDMTGMQPQPVAISPTIAIFQNYLFIATKKGSIENIVNGVNAGKSLLESMDNSVLKTEIEKDGMMQLRIKLGEILSKAMKLSPDPSVAQFEPLMRDFEELYMTAQIREKGLYSDFIIQTKEDFIKVLLKFAKM